MARLGRAGYAGADALTKLWQLGRVGAVLVKIESDLLPILGLRQTEILKGLFNRFPVRPDVEKTTSKFRVAATSDGGGERLVFRTIASLSDLTALGVAIDGLGGLLHLAALTSAGAPLIDLDRQLSTAVARVLLGGPFTYQPLNPADMATLASLPNDVVQTLTESLFAGIEGTLSMALMDRDDHLPEAGRQRRVQSAVQAAVADLSDLAMSLAMAREHDKRADGDVSSLEAVIDLNLAPIGAGIVAAQAEKRGDA